MKLVLILDAPVKKSKKGLSILCGYTPQIEFISQYFDKMIIYAPLAKSGYEMTMDRFTISRKNIEFKPLIKNIGEGNFYFIKNFFLFRKKIQEIIKMEKDSETIFTTYIPGSFIGLLSAYYFRKFECKYFLRITADLTDEFRRRGNKWYRKSLALFLSPFIDFIMKFNIKNSLCFYSGKILYNLPGKSYKIISASFYKRDIVKRTDISRNKPYNILYVGRFDSKKGVPYLIDAIEILVKKNIPIKLTLVGGLGNQETIIKQKIIKIKNYVDYKGLIAFGDDLFNEYKKAQIFVIPSLEDMQGKTQLEAMAFGTPVIGSNVGGIPEIIKDNWNGILVRPGNSKDIANAIEKILNNKDLRKKFIKHGLQTANKYTLEYQIEFMIKKINKYFKINLEMRNKEKK